MGPKIHKNCLLEWGMLLKCVRASAESEWSCWGNHFSAGIYGIYREDALREKEYVP